MADDQLRRALEAIRQLKARLAAAEARPAVSLSPDPIAIVGLGVRFPGGVTTPAELWALLREGRDAITEVPANRWNVAALYDPDPAAPGKISTRHGGFIADVEHFDPRHFGIAPAEAAHLDPQHRLLLETAWEALEHAAIAPDRLAGQAVGVFVGISSADYAQRLFARGLASLDPYVGSGNAHSVAAGRLAYTLGLHGPALAVDTACSSSLVATHLACQSLRAGESELALVGGVNLLLGPAISVNHSRARMLSADGRCHAFGAAAEGFGRAEGCAVVALKPLAAATRDGDRVLAVIHGSAVNQDGRTSGLTVPNGQAQQAVIRAALAAAGFAPGDIDYVEAHGTGTSLGDPIEVRALGGVFAAARSAARPLLIGSIKSNFGHTEAAAGLAGLIKVVLALQHGELPPHLHASPPSPRIAWDELPLRVTTTAHSWPAGTGRPRLAGVSSFGFGGTNAHLILGESPPVATAADAEEPADLLPLSARTSAALARLAARYAAYWANQSGVATWSDFCHTAAIGRASWPCRALFSGPDAAASLRAFAAGAPPAHVAARTATERPRIAFLFSGQGSLEVGAGLALRETLPAFRAAFDEAAAIVRRLAGWDVAAALADPSQVAATARAQVALFCLGHALARTWQTWGIEPDFVLGHSVGEYPAAVTAGLLELEPALRLLIARAEQMGALPADGAMVAVSATAEEVSVHLTDADVEIGAYNAPGQVVITGPRPAVTACADTLGAHGLRTHPLAVGQAYHSAAMEPMLPGFRAVAATTPFRVPDRTFISSVTGQADATDVATPEYWVQQIRRPVRWAEAVRTLQHEGADLIIEVGPRALLTALSRQTWSDSGPTWLASLRTAAEGAAALRAVAAHAWLQGAPLRWPAVQQDRHRRRLELPTYPFERERYWCDPAPSTAPAYTLAEISQPLCPATGDLPALQHFPGAADDEPLALQAHLTTASSPVAVVVPSEAPAAGVWQGAAQSLALEFPATFGGLLLTPAGTSPAQIEVALRTPAGPPAARLTAAGLVTSQLRVGELPVTGWRPHPKRSYLITGGLGALGQHVADWLVTAGARSLHLLGRRPPGAEVPARLAAWRARGVTIQVTSADVTDRTALTALLVTIGSDLGGVFHAAGAPAYQRFGDITPADWHDTLHAKVVGARLLDELTTAAPPEVFVLFSSIAAVWGSQGQVHYAAANAALDALARQRRAAGRPALAVNWGPWSGGGMATPDAAEALAARGIRLLDPARALTTLAAALASDHAQVLIADIDWPRLRGLIEQRGPRSLFAALSPFAEASAAEASVAPFPSDPAEALAQVQRTVAAVLKLPKGELPAPHTGFANLGLDSLMALDLRNALARAVGFTLPATLIFDYPDCERLATHLLERLNTSAGTPPPSSAPTAPPPVATDLSDREVEEQLARKLAQLGL